MCFKVTKYNTVISDMCTIYRAWHFPLPDSPGQVKLPIGQVGFDKDFFLKSYIKKVKFWKSGKWKFEDISSPDHCVFNIMNIMFHCKWFLLDFIWPPVPDMTVFLNIDIVKGNSCPGDCLVITGGTEGCQFYRFQCLHWSSSHHHENLFVSVKIEACDPSCRNPSSPGPRSWFNIKM